MNSPAPSFLIGSSSLLQVTRTCIKAWMSFEFNQIRPLTTELPTLERLKTMYNVVNTLAPSVLIGSPSFLQLTRTTIKFRMSLKIGQMQTWTAELPALERPKNLHRLTMGEML